MKNLLILTLLAGPSSGFLNLEGGDVGRGVEDLCGAGVYLLPVVQLLVLVAGDLMPGVEVARDALEVQFLCVVLVVEVGRDAIVGNPFRKKVVVAFLA